MSDTPERTVDYEMPERPPETVEPEGVEPTVEPTEPENIVESHPEVMPVFVPPIIPPLVVEIVAAPMVEVLPSIDLDRVMTPLMFMGRLTEAENDAIATAAMGHAGMFRLMLSLTAAQEVSLDDERTIAGVQAMVAAGILTAERADEVLGKA